MRIAAGPAMEWFCQLDTLNLSNNCLTKLPEWLYRSLPALQVCFVVVLLVLVSGCFPEWLYRSLPALQVQYYYCNLSQIL